MSVRPLSLLMILLIILTISAFVLFPEKIATNGLATGAPQKTEYVVTGMPPNPPLVRIKDYPPATEQGKAQWEWWRRMMKQDRGFQWKMPISFYGRVLDQFNDPVSGAKVKLQWSSYGQVPERTVYTDNDGLFSLEGAQGKGISI